MAQQRDDPDRHTRRTVEAMAAFGIDELQIARAHGLSRTVLRRDFRKELATGAAKANAKVVASLFDQAIGGNVSAMIWWTKARMGWHEVIRNETTGKDSGPLVLTVVTGVPRGASADVFRLVQASPEILPPEPRMP